MSCSTETQSATQIGWSMSGGRPQLAALTVVGGTAVLASYVWGSLHPELFRGLWGGVPESLRPLYTVNMFLAAAGFLIAFATLLRGKASLLRRELLAFYALILIPSALWLPLTFAYLEDPSPLLWLAIRIDLLAVGVGGIGVTAWLAIVKPGRTRLGNRVATLAMLPFVLQTAVLDALVWPAFFAS